MVTESDPKPPSGDLKHDITSFDSVDACARARGTADPVLADAIDSLGYDTLTRDACRLLEALKSRDRQLCKPISSSTLRSRCESNVAVLIGDANLCPLNGLTRGEAHDPLCVARAHRDERFCAAVASFRRSICNAMVTGHVDDCRGDESCIRQIERWKSLLEAPSRHAPFSSHLHIEITPDKGTPDPPSRSFDLDDDAAAGAVVKIVGDRLYVALGSPKTPYWPSSDAGYARARIFVEVGTLPRDTKKSPTDFTLDLLLPKVGTFSSLTSDERTIDAPHWSSQVGEPLKFTIATKLGDAPRYYAVKIAVETYVRDVIDAASSERRP